MKFGLINLYRNNKSSFNLPHIVKKCKSVSNSNIYKERLIQIKNERTMAYGIMIMGLGMTMTIIGAIIGLPCIIYATNKLNKLKIEELECQ